MPSFDFSSLTPVEGIALGDTLYDSAMREIAAMTPLLTAAELAEIAPCIADIEAGRFNSTL